MNNSQGTLTIYTNVDTRGIDKGINSITKSMNRLSSTLNLSLGIAGLIALGREAVNSASDLQEYRNVAEVTFGNLIYKLDELNKISIKSYGMSRLMATQAASGFMAMGNAAGLAKEEASDMAIGLTKFMGDFASFHDMGHERARTALAAVYTGETETLKQYGIMLQEVNLQQYENTMGLGRSIKTMTAAEKAQLRYNYILHVGKDAVGDFERTQNSWANQTRVLKENFKELLVTLGNGLITVLTPLVKILNQLIAATHQFIITIGYAIANIFGIEVQTLSSGYKDTAENADAAAGAQEELGDATKDAAKEAKKSLAAWDDLNVLQNPDDGKDKGGSGGAGGGLSEETIKPGESLLDKMKSSIDSLYELGKYIADTLSEVLEGIDWDSVYEHARKFGTGLAEFLNGLFQPRLFAAVGKTIAGSINTIFHALLAFAETFDWKQFGHAIAAGINSFVDMLDPTTIAEAINKFVQGIFTTLVTAISEIDWMEAYNKIVEFLEALDFKTVAIIIGALTIKKIGKAIFGFNVAAWLSGQLTKVVKGKTISLGLGKIVATLGSGGLLETGTFLGKLIDAFALAAGGAGTLNEAFMALFGTVGTVFGSVVSIVTGAFTAIWNFISMLQEGFSWVKEIFMVLGIAIAGVGAVIAGIAAPIAAVIAGVVATIATAIVLIKDHWNQLVAYFKWQIDVIKSFFLGIWEFLKNGVMTIVNAVVSFVDYVGLIFEGLWIIIQAIWITVADWFNENVITPLVEFFSPIVETVSKFFSDLWDKIKEKWSKVSKWFSDNVIEPFKKNWDDACEKVKGFFKKLWNAIASGVVNAMNAVIGAIEGALNGIIDLINSAMAGFNKVVSKAAEIAKISWGGIPQIGHVSFGRLHVPELASGAVIPPNKQFMAILGDQKHGTNIEAPLDTIKQALSDVLGNFSQPASGPTEVVLQLDGQTLARLLLPSTLAEMDRSGYNISVLEG